MITLNKNMIFYRDRDFFLDLSHIPKNFTRLFSTSFKMNDTQYKTKNFIFENSSGFNLIKNILKSDDKPEVKQNNVEEALNQV